MGLNWKLRAPGFYISQAGRYQIIRNKAFARITSKYIQIGQGNIDECKQICDEWERDNR